MTDATSDPTSTWQSSDTLTFEQGNEDAPDSPWGHQRVAISAHGALEYEQKHHGMTRRIRGRVNPERILAIHVALARTTFPTPPETRFLPGSSLVVLTMQPSGQRMLIDYFTGMKLDGYRDVLRALSNLNDALREAKTEVLNTWGFEAEQ